MQAMPGTFARAVLSVALLLAAVSAAPAEDAYPWKSVV